VGEVKRFVAQANSEQQRSSSSNSSSTNTTVPTATSSRVKKPTKKELAEQQKKQQYEALSNTTLHIQLPTEVDANLKELIYEPIELNENYDCSNLGLIEYDNGDHMIYYGDKKRPNIIIVEGSNVFLPNLLSTDFTPTWSFKTVEEDKLRDMESTIFGLLNESEGFKKFVKTRELNSMIKTQPEKKKKKRSGGSKRSKRSYGDEEDADAEKENFFFNTPHVRCNVTYDSTSKVIRNLQLQDDSGAVIPSIADFKRGDGCEYTIDASMIWKTEQSVGVSRNMLRVQRLTLAGSNVVVPSKITPAFLPVRKHV